MDVVITYVDGNDPVWQKDYERFTNVPILQKRFRDWGTLKYLLRGIQVNMPFIRNVYLVVSHPSQVPQWVDRNNLKIVLHEDIIPAEYLPTFNSTTIEMYLHRIPALDEQYIYFNDDIFPVMPSVPEDFFRDGKAVIGMSRHLFVTGMYKRHVRRSDSLARAALGLSKGLTFLRAQHSCIPVLKSQSAEVAESQQEAVKKSMSRVRDDGNINMTLFLSYMYHKSLVINQRQSCRHISLAAVTQSRLRESIMEPERRMLCINDVRLSEDKFTTYRDLIIGMFENRFPLRSRFEL
jgi:hypothetical protein